MRKMMQRKLSLHRETLGALQEETLHGVVGGGATLATCGKPCSKACTDTCTVGCPTQGPPPHCPL
jgi:hypothetical protein